MTSAALPKVAVIIPHFDDLRRLELCLSALTAGDHADAEIVVVDNGSPIPPETHFPVTRFPAVRFVTETERGAAAARNRGVGETRAPILAFLDCDCIPAPGWIDRAAHCLEGAEVVGGRVEVFDETPPPRSGAEAYEAVFAFDVQRYVTRKRFAVTANLVTTRRVFEDVGTFRGGLSEDLEWCQRATTRGHRLTYAPALSVRHPSRSDWAALERKWRRLSRESADLQKDGAARRARLALRALVMPASALIHLPKILLSPRLHGSGERLRGAATLIHLRLMRTLWLLRQSAGLDI